MVLNALYIYHKDVCLLDQARDRTIKSINLEKKKVERKYGRLIIVSYKYIIQCREDFEK